MLMIAFYLRAAGSVSGAPVDFEVVKLASRPACFHVGGFLSEAECEHLIAAADAVGMEQATTAGGDNRNGCGVAWLPVAKDDTAAAVSTAVEQLFLQPELLEPSDYCTGGRFENVQVLKYTEGGEFKLHYDANERTPRVLVRRCRCDLHSFHCIRMYTHAHNVCRAFAINALPLSFCARTHRPSCYT